MWLLAKNGQLNEAALLSFARQRKYEETVVALAELSRSDIDVIRPLMQSLRDDGVLIPCRVAGLSWDTVAAVLNSRFASGSMGPHELAKAKDALRQTDAGQRPAHAALLAGPRRPTRRRSELREYSPPSLRGACEKHRSGP